MFVTASKSPDLSEKVSEGGVVGAEPAQVAAQALPINVTVLTTPLYATKMQEDRLADLTGEAPHAPRSVRPYELVTVGCRQLK